MSPLVKVIALLVFIVAEAIFEAWLNEKMGVVIQSPSSLKRIVSRVVTMVAGGIIVLLQTM
jgi:hypothetical protein